MTEWTNLNCVMGLRRIKTDDIELLKVLQVFIMNQRIIADTLQVSVKCNVCFAPAASGLTTGPPYSRVAKKNTKLGQYNQCSVIHYLDI